ncbi:hypothetical protein ACLOJK_029258 [Asimina triloba]
MGKMTSAGDEEDAPGDLAATTDLSSLLLVRAVGWLGLFDRVSADVGFAENEDDEVVAIGTARITTSLARDRRIWMGWTLPLFRWVSIAGSSQPRKIAPWWS